MSIQTKFAVYNGTQDVPTVSGTQNLPSALKNFWQISEGTGLTLTDIVDSNVVTIGSTGTSWNGDIFTATIAGSGSASKAYGTTDGKDILIFSIMKWNASDDISNLGAPTALANGFSITPTKGRSRNGAGAVVDATYSTAAVIGDGKIYGMYLINDVSANLVTAGWIDENGDTGSGTVANTNHTGVPTNGAASSIIAGTHYSKGYFVFDNGIPSLGAITDGLSWMIAQHSGEVDGTNREIYPGWWGLA